jgi:undecaprenyl-diphosphatase
MLKKLKKNQAHFFIAGVLFIAFVVWTALVLLVDVGEAVPEGTVVGFSTLNMAFFESTGGKINETFYKLSEILGLTPIAVIGLFAVIGVYQLIHMKSIRKMGGDLFILGAFYLLVLAFYGLFEIVEINYRPVLIDGVLEASYPSSHTLLALCVFGSAIHQFTKRIKVKWVRILIISICAFLMCAIVLCRLLSGVHWLTDIIGGVLLSGALVSLYCSLIKSLYMKTNE